MFFFPKIGGIGTNSLKIIKDGVEMSLGSDDNCGSKVVCSRSSIAFFKGDDMIEDHPLVEKYGDMGDGSIDVWNDPEKFARVLCDFLEIKMEDKVDE